MAEHLKVVAKYNGTLAQLAQDIANLHHAARAEFFEALTDAIRDEAQQDQIRGYKKLSKHGFNLVDDLRKAVTQSEIIAAYTEVYEQAHPRINNGDIP